MMHRGQKTAVSNLATNMLLTKTVQKNGAVFLLPKKIKTVIYCLLNQP